MFKGGIILSQMCSFESDNSPIKEVLYICVILLPSHEKSILLEN